MKGSYCWETRKGNIRSSGNPSTPKAEEGYCNEATQSGPLNRSQSHPTPKYSGTYRGKTKKGLDKRGNKRNDMMLYVLLRALYKKKLSKI